MFSPDRKISGDGSAAAVPRLQRDEERELGEPPVHQGGPHHPACEKNSQRMCILEGYN